MEHRLSRLELPVVRAWRKLAGPRAVPEDVLELERTWKKSRARPVYCLRRRKSPSFEVIAKPCKRDEVERTFEIYREVLDRLPLRAPNLIGSVPGGEPDREWLFLESVQGAEYSPEVAAHRRLSAAWLATLHVEASRLGAPTASDRPYLYDISSPAIHQLLETAASHLEAAASGRLARGYGGLIASLSRQCERLERHWEDLRALGAALPRTLVHGDFCVSNMLVVDPDATDTGTAPPLHELVVFDWQRSGWAAPAFDLTRFLGSWAAPDLGTYLEIAGQEWNGLDETLLRRLAYLGEILRWIEALRWDAERLQYGWPEGPLARLAIYERWMEDIRAAAPWRDAAPPGECLWRSVVPYGRPPGLAPGAPVHA